MKDNKALKYARKLSRYCIDTKAQKGCINCIFFTCNECLLNYTKSHFWAKGVQDIKEEKEMKKTKEEKGMGIIEINKIPDAKSGACFHGEVWVRCPHCNNTIEIQGARYEYKENGFRVYKCKSCGKYFKDK